jgi:hypothetical protein
MWLPFVRNREKESVAREECKEFSMLRVKTVVYFADEYIMEMVLGRISWLAALFVDFIRDFRGEARWQNKSTECIILA